MLKITMITFAALISAGPVAQAAAPKSLKPIRPLRHPCLLFTAEEIPGIRARAQDKNRYDGYISSHDFWLYLKKRADKKLKVNVNTLKAPTGSRWRSHWGACYGTASTLAFAYVVTGDERYAAKAKEFALYFAALPAWSPKDTRKVGFATGGVTREVALAYDILYDKFSDAERKILRRALLEKGLKPIHAKWFNKDPLTTFHENSLMGCWQAYIYAALVLYDDTKDPLPREALRFALKWFEATLEWSKEDGGWHEGLNYGMHSIHGAAETSFLLKRYFGLDYYNHPFIRKAPLFYLHFIAPNGHTVDFNDAHTVNSWPAMAHLANVSGDRWIYGLYKRDRSLLRLGCTRSDLFSFVNWKPATKGVWPPPFPTSRIFPNIGWVALRDKWTRTGTLFALKSGQPKWSHEQPDGNHFVLNYQGAWLITDNGYATRGNLRTCNYQYFTGGHNTVIVDVDWDELEENRDNVKANMKIGCPWLEKNRGDAKEIECSWNCQINGQAFHALQRDYRGERFDERLAELPGVIAKFKRGHVKRFLTTDFFDYVVTDAHELYKDQYTVKRFDRHVLFDKLGMCFIIFDDLASDRPRWWDFILHTNGSHHSSGDFKVNERERLVTVTVNRGSFKNLGATLKVHVLAPAEPQITARKWWKDSEQGVAGHVGSGKKPRPSQIRPGKKMNEAYGPYLSIRARRKLPQANFMTLLRPRPRYTKAGADAKPKPYVDAAVVKRLGGKRWAGAEITDGPSRAVYLCRLGGPPAEIKAAGVATDAVLTAVRFKGDTVETAAIVDGKVLRIGKDDLLRAGAPVTAALRWTDATVSGHVDVRAACALALHVGSAGIDRATLNGKPIRFLQQKAGQTVHLQLPGSGELEVSFKKK